MPSLIGMSEQPGIRGVIFDMDGVLTDSEPLINAAAIAMFKERGLVVQPGDFLPFVGTGENRYIGGVAEKYCFPLEPSGCEAKDLRDIPGTGSGPAQGVSRRGGIGPRVPGRGFAPGGGFQCG